MKLYGGIDLHAPNNVVVLVDEQDRVVYEKRLRNDLGQVLQQLAPYQPSLQGLAVESTYHWYWLVDGLMEAGYVVHLANTAAIQQYAGLKYTDDRSDARWLAHLLRLGLVPAGYIDPKAARPVRDLLRKRSQLVRQKPANLLSIQNLIMRNTGVALSANRTKHLTAAEVEHLLPHRDLALAVQSNLAVMRCLEEQIGHLERTVKEHVRGQPAFSHLQTVPGIGPTLGLTVLLETGDIRRFAQVGHFASYCRCVASAQLSNRKKKGEANRRNGNKYLAWAFVEAAHCAVRYHPRIHRFYQRKRAQTHGVVAIKAVAHKLARACYYVLRDHVPFDVGKAFA